MTIIPLCPLRASSLLWSSSTGLRTFTVVCKATYRLAPELSPLHVEQEPPNEEDSYWDDDPSRSLSSPSDLVPFKARADVLLVGNAFAPGQRPVRSLVARLHVGAIDKSIEVFGKRAWSHDGKLREGSGFALMPLAYERAGGGPGTWNPVGVRADGAPDVHGEVTIPYLQPPGLALARRGEFVPPVGFGPIASGWAPRVERLGRHCGSFSASALRDQPVPDDIDPAYFNAAPRDQQIDAIQSDERIILENLHPEHPRLVTSLPGVRPRVFVEKADGTGQDVPMRCDTLWIDTVRGICTLAWRGHVPLEGRRHAGRVLVVMEERGQQIAWADVARMHGAHANEKDAAGEEEAFDSASTGEIAQDAGMTILASEGMVKPALPFLERRGSWSTHDQPRARVSPVGADLALPFARATEVQAENQAKPALGEREVHAPPIVLLPEAQSREPSPLAPVMAASPWAGSALNRPALMVGEIAKPSAEVLPPPLIPGDREKVTGLPVTGVAAKPGARIGVWRPPGSGSGTASGADSRDGIPGSALAASNAAAALNDRPPAPLPAYAPSPSRATVTPLGADVIDLIWFDPDQVARIRKHAAWKKIIAEAKARPWQEDLGDAEPREKRQQAKDRRDVLAVLRHGEPAGTTGLAEELAAAMADGTFTPPLAFVDGVLEFPFDEKETLKATMALVAPFTAGDKRLKEQSDTITELLKSPWLDKGSAGLESYTTRLREAFAQPARGLPPGYLEAHTERLLLEQRHYQKRTLLGQEWIRALLLLAGARVPTYLPERLAKELPMYQRLRVRAVVEVRLQLDQFEAHSSALRVFALGRLISVAARW